jgi:hypothetical protein
LVLNKYETYISSKVGSMRRGKGYQVEARDQGTASKKAVELFLKDFPKCKDQNLYIYVGLLG